MQALVYRFLNRLSALPFIDAIYLYGSRARGDQRPRSDIDLAIVCPKAASKDWQQVFEIIEQADTLLKIDCVRYDKITNLSLKAAIDKDKEVLYER